MRKTQKIISPFFILNVCICRPNPISCLSIKKASPFSSMGSERMYVLGRGVFACRGGKFDVPPLVGGEKF